MNLRKLFALLMVAIMLLGMVPAQAQSAGECVHMWDYSNGTWLSGRPAGCQDCKPIRYPCMYCSATLDSEAYGLCVGNNWHWDGTPPSCGETGMQIGSCQYCGEPMERNVRGEHSWGAWEGTDGTCLEPGREERSCHYCGATEYRNGSVGAHDWGSWEKTKPGTCVEAGEETRTCNLCGKKETRATAMGEHQWGSWVATKPGTCVQVGEEQRSCAVCGKTETRTTGGGGHKYGEYEIVKGPKCTEPGRKEHYCEYCGRMEWGSIPETGHDMGSWYVFEAPQVGLPGIERRDCLNECGYFETREIPALEQDFDNVVINPGDVNVAPGGPNITGPDSSENTGNPDDGFNTPNDNNHYEVITPGGSGDPESAAGLSLSLVLSSTPANGTHFVVGETVVFTAAWANTTPYTLKDQIVSIGGTVAPVLGSELLYLSTLSPEPDVEIAPGASGSHSLTVVVSEADVANGAIHATADFSANTKEGVELGQVIAPFVTAPCGEGTLANNDGVHLEKFIRNAPANGEYYVPGEVLNYALTLRIDDGLLLDDAAIYDPIIDNDGLVISEGKGLYGSMGMDIFYTVTEEDAQRGYVENTAYATWIYSDSGEAGYCESETVIAPCGSDNSGDFGLTAGLSVTKTVTSTPANGSYYEPGEVIFFEITATNTSAETLTNLTFHDPLISDAPGATVPVFAPGEAASFQAFYPVTDADAFAGSVTNIAYVTATDADGRQVVEYSNIVTVPCGHTYLNIIPTPDDPFGIFHSLAIVKTEESLPQNGQYYTEGEVIHYTITYTNDGELPLTDVEIWDALNTSASIASAEMLNPGESRVCYYQHTVTAEDVAAGSVMNVAHASYPVPNAAGFVTSTSNVVISKTSADENIWIELPIFPTPGEDPEYDPGTGWFPSDGSIPEGYTPPFGTIDTDKLRSGDSYCVRTITGRDNASVSYETSFCAEHADTQSSALLMQQAAAAPELQMQAAAYAVALWRTEVEALYQELYGVADPQAKMVVMTEYVRFLTEVANYEAMLKVLHPDQPALVAQMVAAMWEDKCVTLCYEMHVDAAGRKDNLLSVTPAVGVASAACDCVTTNEVNAAKAYTQHYCPMHGFPFSMIDMLLNGQDTAEAWTMVRQIWGVELTNSYNKIYTAMGDNKLLAMAEYNALTQWMMAREASLIALYPENPEIVVQTMVKIIIDRVNVLCQNGK